MKRKYKERAKLVPERKLLSGLYRVWCEDCEEYRWMKVRDSIATCPECGLKIRM